MNCPSDKSNWGYIWRWLAITFIISTVIIAVNMVAKLPIFINQNFITRLCSISWGIGKNVIIIDPSIYIQPLSFSKSIVKNVEWHKNLSINGCFAAYNAIDWREFIGKIKTIGDVSRKTTKVIITNHFPGRRLSSIFENYYKFTNTFSGFYIMDNFFNKNIRPLTVNRVFLGCFPQLSISTYQSPGEKSDYRSRNSGNERTEEISYCLQGAILVLWRQNLPSNHR